jgi:hypothetical protein
MHRNRKFGSGAVSLGGGRIQHPGSRIQDRVGGRRGLFARGEIERREIVVDHPDPSRDGVSHQNEPRVAGTGAAPMGQAALGMDRHHMHPLAWIGEPAIAAEGFEVIHLLCFTQFDVDWLPLTTAK